MKKENFIGRRIRALRKDKKLTQEALSEKAAISREYLSKVENGARCSEDILSRIAGALTVPAAFLMWEKGDSLALAQEIAGIIAAHNAWEAYFLFELVKAASHFLRVHRLYEDPKL